MTNRPRFVALCGAPQAGKSEVAQILCENYQAQIVDDGYPLRAAVSAVYGIPIEYTYSTEGKDKVFEVCGKPFTLRQLLGDLGNLLEGFYGEQFMPERALDFVQKGAIPTYQGFKRAWGGFYIFPSVRKTQGHTYRKHGGLVVEITRPGYAPKHDFDQYDPSFVTHTIRNDKTLFDLECRVVDLFSDIYHELVVQ